MRARLVLGGLIIACLLGGARAADLPPPRDVPYPGLIELKVDATDLEHRIFKVHEHIPTQGGSITLLYPQWHLGTHAPADRMLSQFAGLIITADGQRLDWVRDPVNVYAFHVRVPERAQALDAQFEFLSPVEAGQGAVVMTPELLAVHWESLVLYPAGFFARGITVKAEVTLPQDWPFAGALDVAERRRERALQAGQSGGTHRLADLRGPQLQAHRSRSRQPGSGISRPVRRQSVEP